MHDFAQNASHAPAQHLPAGWNFPTLTPVEAPPAAAPVTGGGAATAGSSVTRVRWGRLLPVMAGVALLAFGVWNVTKQSAPSSPSAKGAATVSGGGGAATPGDEIDIAKASRTPSAAIAPATAAKPPVTAKKPAPAARPATPAKRPAPARPSTGARRPAPALAAAATAAAAPGGPTTVAGGGGTGTGRARPAAQLPYTGIETWIAAFLGVAFLAIGICIHVNAVRIGMTAMLYRRGLLLRPVECARLAQENGLSRLRVVLSNVLHRLLEERETGGEFVSARHAL